MPQGFTGAGNKCYLLGSSTLHTLLLKFVLLDMWYQMVARAKFARSDSPIVFLSLFFHLTVNLGWIFEKDEVEMRKKNRKGNFQGSSEGSKLETVTPVWLFSSVCAQHFFPLCSSPIYIDILSKFKQSLCSNTEINKIGAFVCEFFDFFFPTGKTNYWYLRGTSGSCFWVWVHWHYDVYMEKSYFRSCLRPQGTGPWHYTLADGA